MTLGERLQTARQEKGMTQEDIAQELFVTRQTISRWEQNKTLPNIHVLEKLSQYYDTPLENFVSEKPDTQEEKKMKRINFMALFGVFWFNLLLGVAVIISIAGLLFSLWTITISFIASPFLVLGAGILNIQAITWTNFGLSVLLAVVGGFLYPRSIKISVLVYKWGKSYVLYNLKTIYREA